MEFGEAYLEANVLLLEKHRQKEQDTNEKSWTELNKKKTERNN